MNAQRTPSRRGGSVPAFLPLQRELDGTATLLLCGQRVRVDRRPLAHPDGELCLLHASQPVARLPVPPQRAQQTCELTHHRGKGFRNSSGSCPRHFCSWSCSTGQSHAWAWPADVSPWGTLDRCQPGGSVHVCVTSCSCSLPACPQAALSRRIWAVPQLPQGAATAPPFSEAQGKQGLSGQELGS